MSRRKKITLLSILLLLIFANIARAQTLPEVCTEVLPETFNATGLRDFYWKNGTTIKIKFLGGDSFEREQVEKYAPLWSEYANIKFRFVEENDYADLLISFVPGRSWSYIGTDAKNRGDKASMNFGWINNQKTEDEIRRVILHEFGHLLGLVHEHQSPNAVIDWNKNAVYKYYKGYWTPAAVDEYIFTKYSKAQVNASAYDPESIMHYEIPPEWLESGISVKLNTVLSKMDKEFVARRYPKK